MIIKRGYFFYVSTLPDLDKKIIRPGIPDNFLVRGKFVDNKIRRIRLYKTIEEAISGLYLGENFRKGTKMYVYRALGINKDYLLGPMDIVKVPYAMLIKEFWYTSSLRLEKIGEVKLEKKGEEIFKYGPRQTQAKLYRWGWYEEKRYSLEERDYSIISDLKRQFLILKRNRISKSIQKDIVDAAKNAKKVKQSTPVILAEEQRRLLEEKALENGARIRDEKLPSSPKNAITIKTDRLLTRAKKAQSPEVSVLKSDSEHGINYQILSSRDLGEDTLAHEIGHAINRKNPKLLDDTRLEYTRNSMSGNVENVKSAKPGNIINSRDRGDIQGLKTNYKKLLQEEKEATKNGIGLLRSVGSKRRQIKQAKKNLNTAGKTYRINRISWKSALRDKINNDLGGVPESNYRDDLREMRERRRRKNER